MTEQKREFTPGAIGAMQPSDFKALLELLPSYANLSEIDKGLYIRLATTVHHIESDAVFWVHWDITTNKRVAIIKSLRQSLGLEMKPAIAVCDEGRAGPLGDDAVESLMSKFTEYHVDAKVEIMK